MPWIRAFAVIFTLFSTAALSQPVVRDGKEWLQPADFVNLSWDDVAAVCDSGTGACSGTLGTTDVTGYTWASVDEVSGLFNAYGVTPPIPGFGSVYLAGSAWAPAFLVDFEPTFADGVGGSVWGWARTADGVSGDSYNPYVEDNFAVDATDSATTEPSTDAAYAGSTLGVFLYSLRPTTAPTPVPTFPTYVLIFTVLGLLAIATRRLSRRNAREG